MEHNNKNKNDIMKSVLEKIQAGDIRMKSRGYFMWKMALIIVLALLVLLTSAFFVSFISFSLRASGRLILLGFGWQGLKVFLLTFPWGLFLIDLVLVVVLERMLRSFKFGYRSPLVYLLGGVLVVVVVAGLAIDNETSFHSEVWHAQRNGDMPAFLFGDLYNNVRQPPHDEGVFRGTVVFMGIATPGGPAFLILKSDDQDSDINDSATTSQVWRVILPSNLNFAAQVDVSVGEQILVAGSVFPDGVHAYGIQKVPNANAF
jgi:hypothetical protein